MESTPKLHCVVQECSVVDEKQIKAVFFALLNIEEQSEEGILGLFLSAPCIWIQKTPELKLPCFIKFGGRKGKVSTQAPLKKVNEK